MSIGVFSNSLILTGIQANRCRKISLLNDVVFSNIFILFNSSFFSFNPLTLKQTHGISVINVLRIAFAILTLQFDIVNVYTPNDSF